jgi:hypothetical protein
MASKEITQLRTGSESRQHYANNSQVEPRGRGRHQLSEKISRSVATLIRWVWCFGSHDMKHQGISSKWVEDSTSIIHARGRAGRANLGDCVHQGEEEGGGRAVTTLSHPILISEIIKMKSYVILSNHNWFMNQRCDSIMIGNSQFERNLISLIDLQRFWHTLCHPFRMGISFPPFIQQTSFSHGFVCLDICAKFILSVMVQQKCIFVNSDPPIIAIHQMLLTLDFLPVLRSGKIRQRNSTSIELSHFFFFFVADLSREVISCMVGDCYIPHSIDKPIHLGWRCMLASMQKCFNGSLLWKYILWMWKKVNSFMLFSIDLVKWLLFHIPPLCAVQFVWFCGWNSVWWQYWSHFQLIEFHELFGWIWSFGFPIDTNRLNFVVSFSSQFRRTVWGLWTVNASRCHLEFVPPKDGLQYPAVLDCG